MLFFLYIILILNLISIFYQDIKHREVSLILLISLFVVSVVLHMLQVGVYNTFWNALINNIIVGIFLLILLGYANIKMKTSLKNVLGLGDVFMFIILGVMFPTITFMFSFILSLLFSLVLHLIIYKGNTNISIPLAGFMSLFLSFIYLGFWTGLIDHLYLY